MSKITKDGLTRSGTVCFIAVHCAHMATVSVKGLTCKTKSSVCYLWRPPRAQHRGCRCQRRRWNTGQTGPQERPSCMWLSADCQAEPCIALQHRPRA